MLLNVECLDEHKGLYKITSHKDDLSFFYKYFCKLEYNLFINYNVVISHSFPMFMYHAGINKLIISRSLEYNNHTGKRFPDGEIASKILVPEGRVDDFFALVDKLNDLAEIKYLEV